MHPSNSLYSFIVVIGVLVVAVTIYILCMFAWYTYRRHVISLGEENGEKYFPSRRWKPFLNTFNIKEENNSSSTNDDDDEAGRNRDRDVNECVVCLKVFEDGELVRQFPQCQHTFHADCIDKWLYSHSECCPICRSPVTPSSSSRLSDQMVPPNNSLEVSVHEHVGTSNRSMSNLFLTL